MWADYPLNLFEWESSVIWLQRISRACVRVLFSSKWISSLIMKQKFCDPCGSRGSVYCCGIVVKYSYDIDRGRDQIRSALLTRDGTNFGEGMYGKFGPRKNWAIAEFISYRYWISNTQCHPVSAKLTDLVTMHRQRTRC